MGARTFAVGDRVKPAAHVAKELVGTAFEHQFHDVQKRQGTVVRLVHDVWPADAFERMSNEEKEKAYAEGRWVRVRWDYFDNERGWTEEDRARGVPVLKEDLFLL